MWCSELDPVLQRSPDLTEDSGPRGGLNLDMEFYEMPSFWPWCSLCVTGAAETQVLSAGASPQPCLCLLRSDSNCCLQRWLFMGTPFLCLTEGQCSSSERGSDASMWVTLNLLLFFSKALGYLFVVAHQHSLFLLPSLHWLPCLFYWAMLELNALLCIPWVHSIVLCCICKELSPLLVSTVKKECWSTAGNK